MKQTKRNSKKAGSPSSDHEEVKVADPIENAVLEILQSIAGFSRFDQNKILGAVLEANLVERRVEFKRIQSEYDSTRSSTEELSSIIKNYMSNL